jgi:FkbM family methyltransferase
MKLYHLIKYITNYLKIIYFFLRKVFFPVYHKRILRNSSYVLHIGGHTCEERFLYNKFNLKVCFIESDKKSYSTGLQNLKSFTNQRIINETIGRPGLKVFYKLDYSRCNSLLKPHLIQKNYRMKIIEKKKVYVKTLDSIIKKYKIKIISDSVLIIDTQGSELEILKSTRIQTLKKFKYIIAESSQYENYKLSDNYTKLIKFMESKSFKKVYQQKTDFYLNENFKIFYDYELYFKNSNKQLQ